MLRLCVSWQDGAVAVAVKPRTPLWTRSLLLALAAAASLHLLPVLLIRIPKLPSYSGPHLSPISVSAELTTPTDVANIAHDELLQLLEGMLPHSTLPPLPQLDLHD